MFLIIPGSLVLGFFFSSQLHRFVSAVPYLFAYVTLTMAIGCGLNQLRTVLSRPGIMIWTFVLAHILSPLIAYGLGALLFGVDSPYVVGLVLFTIIPLGVSNRIMGRDVLGQCTAHARHGYYRFGIKPVCRSSRYPSAISDCRRD